MKSEIIIFRCILVERDFTDKFSLGESSELSWVLDKGRSLFFSGKLPLGKLRQALNEPILTAKGVKDYCVLAFLFLSLVDIGLHFMQDAQTLLQVFLILLAQLWVVSDRILRHGLDKRVCCRLNSEATWY